MKEELDVDALVRKYKVEIRGILRDEKRRDFENSIGEQVWSKLTARRKLLGYRVHNNNVNNNEKKKRKRRSFTPPEMEEGGSTVRNVRKLLTFLQLLGASLLLLFTFYCVFILHKPTNAFLSRYTQDWIYPCMRNLRLLSIPIVKRFPGLTDYYEESCLISNPFYEVSELECWPCGNVRNVIDLTGISNFSADYSGIPFIVKDAFKLPEFRVQDLSKIVLNNPEVLGRSSVYSSFGTMSASSLLVERVKEIEEREDFHLKWYMNRVVQARLWRKVFPKPYFISNSTEVSLQHFLFLDGKASSPYPLPTTEFANVFLIQSSGSRRIVLIPKKECQTQCKVVSVVLKAKDVLFYNWLYWNPMSAFDQDNTSSAGRSKSKSTSITFMGSFY